MKKFSSLLLPLLVSGCLLESVGPIDRAIKPYGAHWVKSETKNEQRLIDWTRCGGAENLSDGYEKQSGQSNSEFFDGLRLHRKKIRSCMDSKGYVWTER
jgi:hypothetical protein